MTTLNSDIEPIDRLIIAAFAVIADAKDISSVSFYKHYGFIQFIDAPNKLFIPMSVI